MLIGQKFLLQKLCNELFLEKNLREIKGKPNLTIRKTSRHIAEWVPTFTIILFVIDILTIFGSGYDDPFTWEIK